MDPQVYAGQINTIGRLIFIFPIVTFSCDADHKFWQLELVLNFSHNSTQLMLITTNCAVIKVFKVVICGKYKNLNKITKI